MTNYFRGLKPLGFAEGMELLTSLGRIIGPALSDSQKTANSAAMIGDVWYAFNKQFKKAFDPQSTNDVAFLLNWLKSYDGTTKC